MQIDNDGIGLHVADDGDPSGSPVLLLHGITSCGADWDWLVPVLADRHRVLRLDFRGHGRSDRAPGRYDTTGYLSDAVAVCEQVIGAPAIVVGHSLGGMTAATMSQRHPELVRGAVLEDPPLGLPSDVESETLDLGEHALVQAFTMLRSSIDTVQGMNIGADALAGFLSNMPTADGPPMGDVMYPDDIASTAVALLAVDATVLDPILDRSMAFLVDPDRSLPVPTVIVTGDPARPDTVASAAMAQHFADRSPDTRVIVAEGNGHLIHGAVSGRDLVRTVVLGLIERVDAQN